MALPAWTQRLSQPGLSRSGWQRAAIVIAAAAVLWPLAHRERDVAGVPPAPRVWVGDLAAIPSDGSVESKALSSSSLVVPSTELALPPLARAPLRIKNACDSADARCALRPLPLNAPAVSGPVRRPAGDVQARLPSPKPVPDVKSVSLTVAPAKSFSFNPLDHLPDAATLGRPFEAAGSMVSGWVKRL